VKYLHIHNHVFIQLSKKKSGNIIYTFKRWNAHPRPLYCKQDTKSQLKFWFCTSLWP